MPGCTQTESELSQEFYATIEAAERARFTVEGCLTHLREIERQFHAALRIRESAPRRERVLEDLHRRTMRIDRDYDVLVERHGEAVRLAEEGIETDNTLMVMHALVAYGKFCEIILSIFPATSRLGQVLDFIKTGCSALKDEAEAERRDAGGDGLGAFARHAEGIAKLRQDTAALAELIGGLLDSRDSFLSDSTGQDRDAYEEAQHRAGQGAAALKLIKGIAQTLDQMINGLKRENGATTRLGGAAAILGVLENICEVFKNLAAVADNYQRMNRLSVEVGAFSTHGRRLRGYTADPAYASVVAFHNGILDRLCQGMPPTDQDLSEFLGNIDNAQQSERWVRIIGEQLRDERQRVQRARERIESSASAWARWMTRLRSAYRDLLPHDDALLDTWVRIDDYMEQHGPAGLLVGKGPQMQRALEAFDRVKRAAEVRIQVANELPAACAAPLSNN